MKYFLIPFALFAALPVSAHVTVTPKTAPSDSYQTFVVSVPSERDSETTEVRLVIPEGVSSVRPTVKPGWKIETVKEGEGAGTTTAIIWRGGTIPAGLRDEFSFSAKTPHEGTITWKAYQTYRDGKVVAWDALAEHGAHDHESVEGPASETAIVSSEAHDEHETHGAFRPELFFSLLAIGLVMADFSRKENK